MDFDRFPRLRLAHLPTPIQPLQRLSAFLDGPEIWVKRDDCTGLAGGGNKTRKLEFVVADALAKGADTLVTVGGIQSNHTRQVAAAAAIAGLKCELVQRRWVADRDTQYEQVGNILFSQLLGARINMVGGEGRVGTCEPEFTQIVERLKSEGANPYAIPAGASDHWLGGLGYAACAQEIIQQTMELGISFDAIVHATSSGSTQAGLLAGFQALGMNIPVIGIEVDNDPDGVRDVIVRVGNQTLDLLGVQHSLNEQAIHIECGYAGPAYGIPDGATVNAIRIAARSEALLLDPVYEGKAMAGLFGLVKRGVLSRHQKILYLHLGGIPALHAYQSSLSS